jgi:GalNAc-alpha-(1->4)-GalNAc-alpha-(1->3)-diNAcBac-PP-undecaprenol alpha-1,4-N-acetyl-D-galactosaminyltransferase
MKILLLVSSLGSGGAERVASTLCNSWASRGNSVTLVATYSGVTPVFYEFINKVHVISLSKELGIVSVHGKRYIRRLVGLRNLIKDYQPDIVISFLPNVNVATLLATAFCGLTCIVCERSDPSAQAIGWHWRLACQLLYRFADAVCVQTHSVSVGIKSAYHGLKRVVVAPNPLPMQLCLEDLKNTKAGRKSLLSLGRLSFEKRVDLIIDAFSNLAYLHSDWDLHIYGEGPLAKILSLQIEKNGLQDRIFLYGVTSEPWKIMAESDAFVMASQYEGFPNALLEAMGVGLPCISTDCPSGPREISRNGADAMLVAVDDQAGLESALSRLMSDHDLRRGLGIQARISVSDRYSLPTVLNIWDDIFTSLGVKN